MRAFTKYHQYFKRFSRDERGESTVEWVSLTAVIAILLLAVIGYISMVSGGPVATAVSSLMGRMTFSYESGGSTSGSLPGVGVSPPAARVPNAAVPSVVVPSVGVAQMTAQIDLNGEGEGDSGGGFWSWVGDQWDGFTDWAGDQWNGFTGWASSTWNSIVDWWDGLPSWVKGILTGLAAAVAVAITVGVAVLAAIALGISIPVSATIILVSLAIAAVVAVVVGLVYGLTHPGEAFNTLHAFLWSYGAGLVAFVTSAVLAATGVATAVWTWLSQTAWPAILAGMQSGWNWVLTTGWPALLQGLRWLAARPGIILNWVRTIGWPAVVNGLRTATTALWSRFAALFPRLAQILANGATKLGWVNILKWAGLNAVIRGVVYLGELYFDLTEFSWTGLTTAIVFAAIGGALAKIFGVGLSTLANRGKIASVIVALLGKVPDWSAKGLAVAVALQLTIKSTTSFVTSKVKQWFGDFSSWFGDLFSSSSTQPTPPVNSSPTPAPSPGPVPTPPPLNSPPPGTVPPTTTPTPPGTTPTPPPISTP